MVIVCTRIGSLMMPAEQPNNSPANTLALLDAKIARIQASLKEILERIFRRIKRICDCKNDENQCTKGFTCRKYRKNHRLHTVRRSSKSKIVDCQEAAEIFQNGDGTSNTASLKELNDALKHHEKVLRELLWRRETKTPIPDDQQTGLDLDLAEGPRP